MDIWIYLFFIHSNPLLLTECIKTESGRSHNIKETFMPVHLLGLNEVVPKVNQCECFKVYFRRNSVLQTTYFLLLVWKTFHFFNKSTLPFHSQLCHRTLMHIKKRYQRKGKP